MSLICRNISARVLGLPSRLTFCNYSTANQGEQSGPKKQVSERLAEFRKKLRETTPIDNLGEQENNKQNEDPLPSWPNNTNPNTGEVGGPKGPEPTRYGDWERKGRVSDF